MTRLVVFVPEETQLLLDSDHLFIRSLERAKINPERVTFACASHTADLVDIMTSEQAEFGLLAGMSQLETVRPDLSTQSACGRPFYWGEQEWGFLATIHPDAAARHPLWQASVDMHLATLVAWGKNPADMLALSPKECVSCPETGTTLDADLLPWCANHRPERSDRAA